jgi:predicted secreted protein
MLHYKAFLLLLLCGYAFCQQQLQQVTIAPTADQAYTVQTNTNLTIQIQGNPTTGFAWYLENVGQLDSNVIEATNLDGMGSATYVPTSSPDGFVGLGGIYSFTFTTHAPADNVALIFVDERPWDGAIAQSITVTLTITS